MTSEALWSSVVLRDAHWVHEQLGTTEHFTMWLLRQRLICIVPHIDPENPYACGGRQEVDHVKDEPRMGKRAPDDEFHLVAMCQEHNTWHPPRKELRWAEREYLQRCRDNTPSSTASSG